MQENFKTELFWNDIPTERKNAVTYNDLMTIWNTDARGVRRILHELSCYDNGDNYVLIRSPKNKGFYKTDDKDEIEDYKRVCLNMGRSVFAPVRKINRILAENMTQFSLVNNLRVIREDRQMKQTDVCKYMQMFDKNFDVPMLSKMENGACMPTYKQAVILASLYDVDLPELVNFDIYI